MSDVVEFGGKYQAYPEYKESGVEWLGRLPAHWQVKRLGYFFKERREKVSDKEYPALSVTMKGIVPQLENAAKTDAGDNRKLVLKDDFVINSRSDRKGSSGVSSLDGSVSLISIVMTPRVINPKFAHHLLRSFPFQEEFYRHGKGIVADLWSTNSSEMKSILMPEVPEKEQQQIASFLDHETAKIDILIEKQQQLIKLLKEKRQAVISHAVTKGLNPDAPMKDSGVEWLGEVPEHWVVLRLFYVGKVGQGCAFPHSIQGKRSGELPWFKCMDMNALANTEIMKKADNYVDTTLAESIGAPIFPAGTVIFPRVGAALLTNKRRILFQTSVVDDNIYTFVPSKVNSRYIYMFLQLVDMSALCSPGLVPTITFSAVNNIRFSMPPLLEQQEIVEYVDSQTIRIDALIQKAKFAIDLMTERRTALISAAVTGKIDIRNWKAPVSESDNKEATA